MSQRIGNVTQRPLEIGAVDGRSERKTHRVRRVVDTKRCLLGDRMVDLATRNGWAAAALCAAIRDSEAIGALTLASRQSELLHGAQWQASGVFSTSR
ncbi:RraA family protein [Roseomonas populi]|uniref:Transposase n=1 Tax=Roseomonas populi TaxID=3121582 RepID=A0ABT1X4V2_9PROT|nr:hypothetical protein [Roseomonas pecuniae]MCR0983112.1 hypothetical protein [Roseomonas pecuniae]